jgi:REP-associated tyrosine transposase
MNQGPTPISSEALMNQGPTGIGFSPMMSDPRVTLGKVIRSWKAKPTRQIRVAGLPAFTWQPRFYEHIIRGDRELDRFRVYIADNPRLRAEREPTSSQQMP